MPRPHFTIRALLVLLLVIACFFGGILFERERQRREDELAGQPVQFEFGPAPANVPLAVGLIIRTQSHAP